MMSFFKMGQKVLSRNMVVGGASNGSLLEGGFLGGTISKHFSAGKRGDKGVPAFIKPGPSGKIIVAVDPDGGFTKSITKAGSPDKKGAEHGNKIWYITDLKDPDSYGARYSKGTSNLNDARSSAGKNRLNIIYGVDATKMHKNEVLADIAATGKFRRVYLIHPRYTNWEKILKKEEKAGASIPTKTREQALKAEEETQKDTYVIGLNETYLEALMKSAVKMIDADGRVVLLHPTDAPFSTWTIKQIADRCMLEGEKSIPFDARYYPDYCPRRAWTDLKLELVPSEFTHFKIRKLREGEVPVVEEEDKEEDDQEKEEVVAEAVEEDEEVQEDGEEK